MVTRQIELTEEQDEALKEIAAVQGRSVSELIRVGVDNLLRNPARPNREEIKRRALAAIGRFSSGPSDLSTEHDRYLDEAYRE